MLLFSKLRGMWPLLLAGAAFFSSSWAAVTLPPCFSDHMVLQRELPVAVWGLAEPGESVSVSFFEQSKSTRADSEGNWQLHLDPLEAGGPHTMTVKASNTITFKDVLVGEVWLGAGQSNMEYPSGSELFLEDTRLAEIMAAAPYPDIRIMNWNGQWTPATPESIPNFSALLLSFGHRLQPELGVPLGLIAAGRGSTPSGTWLTPAMIEADATCQAQVEAFKQSHTPETLRAQYANQRADWEKEVKKRLEAGRHAPPEPVPLEPGDFQTRKVYRIFPLGVHYRERVEPFAGLTLRAILWDQGESGTGIDELDQFAVMGALIRGWRQAWGREQLPFLYLQKPSGAGCAWDYEHPATSMARPFVELKPDSRVQQWQKAYDPYLRLRALPQAWMVPSSDLGEGLHPVNKSGYGWRAADVALSRVYGRDIPAIGPVFHSATVEGSAVSLRFDHADGGLAFRHGDRLQGFVLTDAATQRRYWADARIEGDRVILSSPDVTEPAAVAYAWAKEYPWANLFNGQGMPALPFQYSIKP